MLFHPAGADTHFERNKKSGSRRKKTIELPPEIVKDIDEILNFFWEDEIDDYVYSGSPHVFEKMLRVHNFLHPEDPEPLPALANDWEDECQ